MAEEEQKDTRENDSEVAGGGERQEILPQQVTNYQNKVDKAPESEEQLYKELLGTLQNNPRRFTAFQKILVLFIVFVSGSLVYVFLRSRPASPRPAGRGGPVSVSDYEKPADTAEQQRLKEYAEEVETEIHTEERPDEKEQEESVPSSQEPLSLQVAQDFYKQKNYEMAYEAYKSLGQRLIIVEKDDELLADFLGFRMAVCAGKRGYFDEAVRLYKNLSGSDSPAIRAFAAYNRSLLELRNKQYLNARSCAYKCLALIDAIELDDELSFLIYHNCHFIAAQCLTERILLFADKDNEVCDELWPGGLEIELFDGLDEQQVRFMLKSGAELSASGLLSPQIKEHTELGEQQRRWSVVCCGASIEELMSRFALGCGFDVNWEQAAGLAARLDSSKRAFEPRAVKDEQRLRTGGVRKRAVNLYLREASAERIVETAAGSVGLMAVVGEKGDITIYEPSDYISVSEHITLLTDEAISLWQGFLLRFGDDKRIANVHFALGLLKSQKGKYAEALAEYKLVTNQFSTSALAPYALLNSSRIKTNLKDYLSARELLCHLVEQYPDAAVADKACLYLADATMKAGFLDEAFRDYKKVYNLGFSKESRAAAALGAGRCAYSQEDYESAADWLARYIEEVKSKANREIYDAYFLLGKADMALGRYEKAGEAFAALMGGQLSSQQYIQAVSGLVDSFIKQEHFIEALGVLENVQSSRLSQVENVEMLLLKSRIFRQMGFVNKVIASLGDRAEYVSEPKLKARMLFELAGCYIEEGRLELARRNLAQVLVLVERGSFSDEAAVELADVCLRMGQGEKTVELCTKILEFEPEERIKKRARLLLAEAYKQQKEYEKAALALLNGFEKNIKTE